MVTTTMERWEKACLIALGALLLALFCVLPLAGTGVYASPDETAAFVAARQIATHGQALIAEPLAQTFPWLHARSWISVGQNIAPVGFLGWPWLASLIFRLGGSAVLPWIGSLLMLSAAWPFFSLLKKKLGWPAAWIGTLVAFTYPAIILYANRGLFANGAVLALALWAAWLLQLPVKKIWQFAVLGIVLALAGASRPVELLWLAPWWLWFGRNLRPNWKQWLAGVVGAAVVTIPILFLASGAYGSAWQSGYFLHDNPLSKEIVYDLQKTTNYQLSVGFLPYGFHPLNIVRNVWSFLFCLLWPWMLVCLAGLIINWRELRKAPYLLGIWTFFVLLVIYGSGKYADNVSPDAVTVGNSFLRYLLPLALVVGIFSAQLWQRLDSKRIPKLFMIVSVLFLVVFGSYRALVGDNEGLWFTRAELVRYKAIRQASGQWFKPDAIIFSDRSDKVFFPDFRAVSPIPDMDEISRLASVSGAELGLFGRPMNQAQKDGWLKAGVEVQELAQFGRERLYRLAPR